MYEMSGFECGFKEGYKAGFEAAKNMNGFDSRMGPKRTAPKRRISSRKSKPVKLNKWQRYMKQKKNKIYYKSGKKKGMLNLTAMSKKYRAKNPKKRS
jgi:hypothetical protein